MKQLMAFLIIASAALNGCVGPASNTTKYIKIDSSQAARDPTLPPEDTPFPKPFCLHIKYSNNYFYFYSENYAEAWITDGACSPEGKRRNIDSIGVVWRYSGQGTNSKLCKATDSCSFSERNYGIGKTINCVSGTGTHRGLTISTSSDPYGC
ncbi:hypothetical protein D3C85_951890 [compost metagenome]